MMTGNNMKPKVFSCTGCGASLKIEAVGYTNTVVCKHCTAVIDVNHPLKKIISQYDSSNTHQPLFQLGSFGVLKGIKWKIIGYVVKEDTASSFMWDEYLLYNPYHGFRWLLEISGHFSMTEKLNAVPTVQLGSFSNEFEYNKKQYKLFNVGQVKTEFVLGEFYWRVKVGDTVTMADYICPPEMLSIEQDGSEINWSVSTYIPHNEVLSAFKMPANTGIFEQGVAANQPNPFADRAKKYVQFILAMAAIFVIWLGSMLLKPSEYLHTFQNIEVENAYTTPFGGVPSKPVISPSFKVSGGMGNIGIEMSAPVNNEWVEASMTLVNESTGQTYDFEQGVEFYSGSDSDGYWSEGSRNSSKIISAVPAGTYHLEVALSSNMPKPTATIVVKRNESMSANFLVAFFALLTPVLWLGLRGHNFEVKRWENSDYSPYYSSDSGGDDYE
jgi:hypothetical protein